MQPTLTSRVRIGAIWNIASLVLTRLIALGRSIVLARLLSPDDFGLFGMALTLLVAMSALTNIGLDTSILATKFTNDDELSTHLDTVWTTELLRKLILSILLLLAVYPSVKFYGDPRLYAILPLISITPFIQGFENIGLVIYRKKINFGRVIWFEQISGIFSTLLAVMLAFLTHNVWALALSQVFGTVFSVLLSYVIHPYRTRLAFDRGAFRQAFSFGKHMFVIGIAAYITLTADNVLVGRIFGAAVLGIYAIGYNLGSIPIGIISSVFTSVTLPAYVELRDTESGRLETAFNRVYAIGASLLTIMTVPIMLLGNEAIVVLYGPRWAAAGTILRIVGLVGFCRGHLPILSPLITSVEGLSSQARAKTFEAIVFLCALFPLTLFYGIKGAAWAGVVAYLVTMLNRFLMVRSIIPDGFVPLMASFSKTLFAGSLGYLAGLFAIGGIDAAATRLAVGGTTSVVVISVALVIILRPLRSEILTTLTSTIPWPREDKSEC